MELRFDKKPLIALPVSDKSFENIQLSALKGKVDLLEFRVDQFEDRDLDFIKNLGKKVREKNFGIILTIRLKEEGGADIPDEQRFSMFQYLIEIADIIDIELNSKINKKVIDLAKDNGKYALVSYHDFEKTPSKEEIQKIIDKGKDLKADIIKYAFKVNTIDDVGRILSITYQNQDKLLVAIGMGDLGKITRVAGFFFGSKITYTYTGKSFAPGQIELNTLIEELKFYGLNI